MKLAKEIVEDMNARGPITKPKNCVTGEEFEKWLYEDDAKPLVWKEVKGIITPGGDACWECPNCKARHVYGVENTNTFQNKCIKCGVDILYPWQAKS